MYIAMIFVEDCVKIYSVVGAITISSKTQIQ